MYYIIFDKENKIYGNMVGSNKKAVWKQFEAYIKGKDIRKSDYEVVKITSEELDIILEWFRKEYLMTTVDKFIVDRELQENN